MDNHGRIYRLLIAEMIQVAGLSDWYVNVCHFILLSPMPLQLFLPVLNTSGKIKAIKIF